MSSSPDFRIGDRVVSPHGAGPIVDVLHDVVHPEHSIAVIEVVFFEWIHARLLVLLRDLSYDTSDGAA